MILSICCHSLKLHQKKKARKLHLVISGLTVHFLDWISLKDLHCLYFFPEAMVLVVNASAPGHDEPEVNADICGLCCHLKQF